MRKSARQPFESLAQRKQQSTNSTMNAATVHVGRNGDVHELVVKPTRWQDSKNEGANERWNRFCDTEDNRRLMEAIRAHLIEHSSTQLLS